MVKKKKDKPYQIKYVYSKRQRKKMRKKEEKIKPYKIKYDHKVDGEYSAMATDKEHAMRIIRSDLGRYPHVKASLQVLKKEGIGWKPHSSYMYRRNKKTGRMRLVKL